MDEDKKMKEMLNDPELVSKIKKTIKSQIPANREMTWDEKRFVSQVDGYPEDTTSESFRNADTFNNIGWEHHQIQEYNESLNLYKQALNICKDFPMVWNNKGLAHFRLGQFDDALHSYKEAIRINPKFIPPYSNIGILYWELKKDKIKAIQWFELALSIDPKYHIAQEYVSMLKNI